MYCLFGNEDRHSRELNLNTGKFQRIVEVKNSKVYVLLFIGARETDRHTRPVKFWTLSIRCQ